MSAPASARLSTRRRAVVAAIAVLATSGAVTAVAVGADAAAPKPLRMTRLTGDVFPGLSKAHLLGTTSPTKRVLVGMVIRNPHRAAITRLERSIYRKGSANYHHFLTPTQFAQRFSAPAGNFAAIKRWATRDGLKVAHANSTNDYLSLSGTAAQADHTFATTLKTYRLDGHRFYANASAPQIPAGLGITGVTGLNNALKGHLPKTEAGRTSGLTGAGATTKIVAAVQRAGLAPAQDNCTVPGTCIGLTSPQDLWSVYDAPTDNYGQGQSMAILGEGETDSIITDLRIFEKLHDLPQIPLEVVRTDGPSADYTDASGDGEWDIDTQSSTGMAPQALKETLYFGSSLTDTSILDDQNAWVQDPDGALQASMSIGECEENPSGAVGDTASASVQYTLETEAALQQAVIEGRTLFNSTGDTGSSCPVLPIDLNGVGNEVVPVVEYPASSPEVVAVGGTVLYTDGAGATTTGLHPSGAGRVEEYSWTFTGGGTSVTFPQPAYQSTYAAPSPTGYCLDAPDGSTVTPGTVTCRGIPDIAAQSGDVQSNGYDLVMAGVTDSQGGGTSLSAPLSLGLWTRVNAAAPGVSTSHGVTYPGLGFANDVYYPDFAAHSGDFFDVGGGGTSPPTSNGAYTSGPGDDYLSGLGIPDYKLVAQHLAGGTAPANDVLPDYPPTSSTSNVNPCASTLFTDPSGDDAFVGDPAGGGSNPQLDILSGTMSVTGSTLTTTMTINNLSTSPAVAAGAGNIYYFLWSYTDPTTKTTTQYFTEATVDTSTGTVTYGDGTVSGTQFTDGTGTGDTGTLTTGPNGTVVVNVPLANIGAPPSGAVLTAPTAQTRVLVGAPQTGGLIEQADAGGPQYDFQIGAVCDPTSPTPTPAGVPTITTSPSAFPTATPTSTTTETPTASPSPSVTVTVTKTETPSPGPTVTTTATPRAGDRTPPRVKIHRKAATAHHRAKIVVTMHDDGTGIAKLSHVLLSRCSWKLGAGPTVRFSPTKHRLRAVITRRSRTHHAGFRFWAVDKAGNLTKVVISF